MKVTNFGQNTGLISNAGNAGNTGSIGGVVIGPPPAGTGGGQAIISSGSNTASWQPVVSTITSNGSNILGPNVNLQSGTGITFSVSSNTLTISGLAGSGDFLEVIGGGKGTVQAHGTLGSTETIDLSLANYHWGTLDADCTISTTGWTNLKDCQITVELIQNGTGGWTPTFSGVTWIGGTPNWTVTAGTVTHVVLFSRDGGTSIYGAVVGGISGSGLASSGAVGAILIADDHSTPLVFADLLQNDEGDDLLYSDVG